MDINLRRNHGGVPSDEEIDRDVAELRQLLAGVEGPKDPHPAYWQNFVVRVRGRIDEQALHRKRRSFVPAWASLGAAAVVTVIVVSSGLLNQPDPVIKPDPPVAASPDKKGSANLASAYDATETESLILSGDDVRMLSAIESNDDDALFEALAEAGEL